MGDFGESLRRERELREISLEEVAKGTKIPRHHLESLERNDLSRLPGGAFSRGYVRAYAQFIGLDPEIIVDEYIIEERAQGHGAPTAEETLQELSRMVNGWEDRQPGVRWLPPQVQRIALAVVAVGAVAVVGWFLWPVTGEERSPAGATPPPGATTVPAQQAATVQTAGGSTQQDKSPQMAAAEPAPVAPPTPPAATPPETSTTITRPEPATATPLKATTTVPEPASAGSAAAIVPEPSSRPAETGAAKPPPEPEAIDASSPPAGTAGSQAKVPTTTPQNQPSRPTVTTMAAEPDLGSDLTIPDFGVGTGVSNRQLVGQGIRFPEGTRVSFWTRVMGGKGGEVIRHVWIREGQAVASVDLRIGGAHWRTHSRKTMRPGSGGSWTVEARDAAGRLLARSDFICTPG